MQFINLLGQNDDKIVISYAGQSESFYRRYIALTVEILLDDLLILLTTTRGTSGRNPRSEITVATIILGIETEGSKHSAAYCKHKAASYRHLYDHFCSRLHLLKVSKYTAL